MNSPKVNNEKDELSTIMDDMVSLDGNEQPDPGTSDEESETQTAQDDKKTGSDKETPAQGSKEKGENTGDNKDSTGARDKVAEPGDETEGKAGDPDADGDKTDKVTGDDDGSKQDMGKKFNPIQDRINQLNTKTKIEATRADKAESRAANAEHKVAVLEADKKVEALDPLDYDDDAGFEAAKKEILESVAEAPTDPKHRYLMVESANTIFDAATGWADKPENFTKALDEAPFGDETVIALAKLDNPAQVAYALSRKPYQLSQLNEMTPEDRAQILEGLDKDYAPQSEKAPANDDKKVKKDPDNSDDGKSTGEDETDTSDTQLDTTEALKGGKSGINEDASIDDYEKDSRSGGNLW